MATILKCKMCGGDLNIQPGASTAECLYCGTLQTIPNVDNERRQELYSRANQYRFNGEFDKAMSVYDQILGEDNTDAEAHWSVVLCKYGIEYVQDSKTGKRLPTINRMQYTSILDDTDYQTTIKYADSYQREIYEQEAKYISEVQSQILEISRNEAPFDIFICYKETDNKGKRTEDSVYAYELYDRFTKEGYRTFFARITLEDKLGTAYEPYIFAALNSARVMVVLGTSRDNFEAVWVRNEWSRYLLLMQQDKVRLLIPVYKNMNPYDLPKEFAYLQAQDMDKIGFMQDLIHGINKVFERNNEPKAVKNDISQISKESLLQRIEQFLDAKQWENVKEYCNRILDSDPKCSMAHFYLFAAEAKASNIDDIIGGDVEPDKNINFKNAIKHASMDEKQQFLNLQNEYTCVHIEKKNKAYKKIKKQTISTITVLVVLLMTGLTVSILKNANQNKKEYDKGIELFNDNNYLEAISIFKSNENYKEAEKYLDDCYYLLAEQYVVEENYKEASTYFSEIKNKSNYEYVEQKAAFYGYIGELSNMIIYTQDDARHGEETINNIKAIEVSANLDNPDIVEKMESYISQYTDVLGTYRAYKLTNSNDKEEKTENTMTLYICNRGLVVPTDYKEYEVISGYTIDDTEKTEHSKSSVLINLGLGGVIAETRLIYTNNLRDKTQDYFIWKKEEL